MKSMKIQADTLHVAIIPDGNRRWARAHALDVWKGHEKGADAIERLARAAFGAGVTHLSLWGSSVDNLSKRPAAERDALMRVYTAAFERLATEGSRESIKARVCVIGRWRESFAPELIELIDRVERDTAHFTEHTLIVFLAYSGDDEMLDAVGRMVQEGAEVTPETLKARLWTHDVPSVDLMVRTGGEPHLSAGFMMWQMANAHLYFTEILFPDFTPEMLVAALEEFNGRGRRLGA
jgi:undecaprenyl diphosphate synthase